MPGLAVVSGCKLQCVEGPEAVCTITTLPSTKVFLGGQAAYKGPLSIQVSGAVCNGFFNATPGTGVVTMNPTCVTAVDGAPVITADCIGSGTLSGAQTQGTSAVPVTLPVTVKVTDAGQTKVNIQK